MVRAIRSVFVDMVERQRNNVEKHKVTVSKEKPTSKIYPNSPLIKVVAEIRFVLNFDIFSGYQRYYELIKDEFADIQVPLVEPTVSPYSQPVLFVNPDNGSKVSLAADRFSYAEASYQGHESFFKEFLSYAELLRKTYKVPKYIRFGLRYTNFIPFSRVDKAIPLRDFLTTQVVVGGNADDAMSDLNVTFTRQEDDHAVRFCLASGRDLSQKEGLILDFDYIINGEIDHSALKSHLEKANHRINELFEKNITEGYRSYLKGESL